MVEAVVHDVLGQRHIVGHRVAVDMHPVFFRPLDIADADQETGQAVRPEQGEMVVADHDGGVRAKFGNAFRHPIEAGHDAFGLALVGDVREGRDGRVVWYAKPADDACHVRLLLLSI
nr:J130 [uncultured bacterium]